MADEQSEEHPEFTGWITLEKLGEGGMCAVYRVRSASGVGPERAIKVLYDTSPSSIERFVAEAELLGKIVHANVLTIHELRSEERPPWIVMDLLAGRDLAEIREEQGAMDPERAARLFADVANGLAKVHEMGVRHRDVKPANIMLGEDGVARLIDFGIAREMAKAHTTQQGFVVGTASYLPPEIYTGDNARKVQDTENADVYALGQTLCEALSGIAVHPTDGNEGPRLVVEIMRDKLERDSLDPRDWRAQVPAGLAEVVMRATEHEPEDRIQTALELESQLRAWLTDRLASEMAPVSRLGIDTLPAPPGSKTATPPPQPRRAPAPRPSTGKVVARTGAAAASAAGITASIGGLALVTIIGLGLLWVLQPIAPAAAPAQIAAVRAELELDAMRLMRCAPDHKSTFTLDFVVDRGNASDVSVTPRGGETADCLSAAVSAVDFNRVRGRIRVQLPILFD